jgi:hypothetical protein
VSKENVEAVKEAFGRPTPGEIRWSELAAVREGRVVLIEMFLDHVQALGVVGLED